MQTDLDRCPLCGSELSQTKYREIKAKLREQEEREATRLAEAKAALEKSSEQELKEKVEQLRRTAEKKAQAQAEQRIQKALSDVQELAVKLKAAEEREANTREEARAEIAKQKESAEKKAKLQADSQLNELRTQLAQATAKAKLAEARESAVRKEVQQQAEKVWQKELVAQRDALEKDKLDALRKQQSEHNRQRASLEKKLEAAKLQVQHRTANDLGDAGEIDLFEAIRNAFDGSSGKTTRTAKGQNGADLLHEVFYKGESCGKIIIDSKVRQGWKTEFASKLRQYRAEVGAEHGIIATTAFPADVRNNAMCIKSGVIVVAPALVVYIVELLRNQMISARVRGLSARQRATKMSRLYELITSESYIARFSEAKRLTDDALELDVQEKVAHDNVWKKRGGLVKRMQYVLREIETDVAAVTETDDGTQEILSLEEHNRLPMEPSS